MNKILKSLLAGSAIIVPIIALFSSQKEAEAFKISGIRLPSRVTSPTVKLKSPNITPVKFSGTTVSNIKKSPSQTTTPKKTLDNLPQTDPQLAKSLDKLGEIITTHKLKIVKVNGNGSTKAPTVPQRGDQTYSTVGESPYETPTTDPIYENVLTIKQPTTKPTTNNGNSTGLKKRPAHNPNKGPAPQPPKQQLKPVEEHIYEEIP
ncbi:hypothetical protein [Candidatus Arthromitus sp. SFB-rat-Yit]|uniref:hypothetical protein n=1 Tax=Candidatus Arthromitus sp. SFB-rat-Yit TaxID=1041504 RepID=UPI000227A312|nr:hypothetical protein [Candidatus Arthromitus sp. SFB-rat-Yit]BAK81452.1 hypothetical protein RATSFB_0890 [Candidatus Arthromitus sp. SFB-rat-Yit]